MASAITSSDSFVDKTGPSDFNNFSSLSESFDFETLFPRATLLPSNPLSIEWDPAWDAYLNVDTETRSANTEPQAVILGGLDVVRTALSSVPQSPPPAFEGSISEAENVDKAQEETAPLNTPSSAARVRQSTPEPSDNHTDSQVGSATEPIYVESLEEEVDSSSRHVPSQSRSAVNSSSRLKRKRSLGVGNRVRWATDLDLPNNDEIFAELRLPGSSARKIRSNPKRVVRPGYSDWTNVVLADIENTAGEDSPCEKEGEAGVGLGSAERVQRLQELHIKRAKLVEEQENVWAEIEELERES